MLIHLRMDFKKKIDEKGLKIKWVAYKIGVNYNSLRVYLMNTAIMPKDIEIRLKNFLK